MTTIVLWVSNLEKSVKFYSALFEDKHPYTSEGFASVEGNGNEVLLHLLPLEYRSEPSYGEKNPIKPVFEVVSLDKAKLAAGSNGGKIKSEFQEHGAWKYSDGGDPDGNTIQVRERVGY
jgi:predicted enzyme related to lactoylglutathione lyase